MCWCLLFVCYLVCVGLILVRLYCFSFDLVSSWLVVCLVFIVLCLLVCFLVSFCGLVCLFGLLRSVVFRVLFCLYVWFVIICFLCSRCGGVCFVFVGFVLFCVLYCWVGVGFSLFELLWLGLYWCVLVLVCCFCMVLGCVWFSSYFGLVVKFVFGFV